ncbi:MAG: transcription termination factor NusA, partial [Gemmataceae bacterium]|nr:transcription termination factor NusA [Gemmataceae bacterium]
MKGSDLLRIVDQMHHEKNIDREIIFSGIEAALQLAAQKKYGEETLVAVSIDRDSGEIQAKKGDEAIDPAELGRIAAQSAKQVMIQKIREAECNAVFDEYAAMKGDLVHGPVSRVEGNAAIVTLGKTESILPRGEQIPGETHHVGERIKAVILDVKKQGHRVKIILSRTHPDFVRRLFENEIPEIADRTIEIKAIAREAGYRCKIAVSSIDLKVDCVGACVGVRGSRIKNIVDELGGERIDIVRWNDSLQVMIPNALQPAQIDEIFLYPRLGRAIVLVKEDQLSLAIGRRGQNVRLASKLVGWDIEIMTMEELTEGVERAENWFRSIPNIPDDVRESYIERFIEEGFLSYDDLTCIDAAELSEICGADEETADEIILFAEEMAEKLEKEAQAKAAAGEPGDTHIGRSVTVPQKAQLSPEQRLFGAETPAEPQEATPTLETLFGPDTGAAAETPPAGAEPTPVEGMPAEAEAAPADAPADAAVAETLPEESAPEESLAAPELAAPEAATGSAAPAVPQPEAEAPAEQPVDQAEPVAVEPVAAIAESTPAPMEPPAP